MLHDPHLVTGFAFECCLCVCLFVSVPLWVDPAPSRQDAIAKTQAIMEHRGKVPSTVTAPAPKVTQPVARKPVQSEEQIRLDESMLLRQAVAHIAFCDALKHIVYHHTVVMVMIAL